MQAGLYRLKHLGITEIHPSAISSAMSRLPDEALALAAASHIERELQITPWNLSSNFVASTQVKYLVDTMNLLLLMKPLGFYLWSSISLGNIKLQCTFCMYCIIF